MNDYARAIEILDAISNDREKEHLLFLEIIKYRPAAIIEAENRLKIRMGVQGMTPFEQKIVELAKTKRIQAIKEFREHMGTGLKESVNQVDHLVSLVNQQKK